MQPAQGREKRLAHAAAAAQIVLAVLALLALCYWAHVVMITVLVSVLLAFIFDPVARLLEKGRFPRPVASLIAVLLLLTIAWGLMYFFYNRAVAFAAELPRYTAEIQVSVGRVLEKARKIQQSTTVVSGGKHGPGPSDALSFDWAYLITQHLGSVGDWILAIAFVPFLVFFMLNWKEHTRRSTVLLFPLEHRSNAYATLGRITEMLRAFLVGNLLIGLFMSLVSGIVFAVLHLPYFYFLGIISGFLSLIPYLGVVLALIPPLTAGLGKLNHAGDFMIIGMVVGLHVFSFNVLYPKMLGRRLQLNPLVVTLALLLWSWMWGAIGLILAIPITAALKIIFDHVEPLRPIGAWLGE